MSLKLNLDNLKSLVKTTRKDYTIFLRNGSYSGKIFPDREGNLISNEVRVYAIPTRTENGDIVTRSFRYYPGNPIEVALKRLSEEGYLGGVAWRYEARPLIKFYFYVVDAPKPPKGDREAPHGPHLAILTGSRKIRGFKDFLNKFLFSGAKGDKEADLAKVVKKVEPYFDPSFPNYGFDIYIQDKSEGSGVIVVPRSDLEIPAFDPPEWVDNINLAYINTSQDWKPTPEYESEAKKAAGSFADLAIEGLLNPKAAEEASNRRRASVPTPTRTSERPPFDQGEEGELEVLPLPPQKNDEVDSSPSQRETSIEVQYTEEDLGAPRYPPADPRSGGPNVILLDAGQIPLCFGYFDSKLPKCRACSSARYCAAAS